VLPPDGLPILLLVLPVLPTSKLHSYPCFWQL